MANKPEATGYSGTPLLKKLGIKPGMKVLALNTPDNYLELLGPLPENVEVFNSKHKDADLIHWFITTQKELIKGIEDVKVRIPKNGSVWISWPKKSSGLQTDITENIIRETILAVGLVDVKVCAIDETWSGLKNVYRLKDR